jgi:hypothetical protein
MTVSHRSRTLQGGSTENGDVNAYSSVKITSEMMRKTSILNESTSANQDRTTNMESPCATTKRCGGVVAILEVMLLEVRNN